jgi:predicted RNA-binding protein with RPS1 domain
VTGVIDVLSVTNERPYQPIDDYPRIGSQVQAVVMGYTPNGQLRLSTRSSDVDPVLEAEEPNE